MRSGRKALELVLSKWQLYLFLLIPVVYIILFAYIPMTGIQLAFKKYVISKGIWGSPWIGFGNFIRFFTSYNFWVILKNTLTISLYSLVVGFPIPILLALMMNVMTNKGYKKVIQTVTYIPYFISVVVLVGMVSQFFNPRIGVFAQLIAAVTGAREVPNLLASANAFPHLYVWSGIWQHAGWNSIIYMAALSSSDVQLHEAATIDGASRLQRVFHIDLPTILPTAIVLLILNTGQIMNVGFEKVFIMQNNMNLDASEVISTYVYKVGLASARADFSYATAIGLFNSLINFLMIVTVNAISKRFSQQSLW